MDHAERQRHDVPDQLENSSDSETEKAEGQQDQPHDWVEDQSQDRQWPARNKQQAPQ